MHDNDLLTCVLDAQMFKCVFTKILCIYVQQDVPRNNTSHKDS